MTIRKMIKFLLILLFIVFPFGELTKLPVGFPEIKISLLDLAVAGLIGIWLIGKIGQICWRKKTFSFARPLLAKPILFFVVAVVTSLLVNSFRLSQRELIVSSLYLIRWVVYAGVYFVVWDLTKFKSLKVSRFKTSLVLVGVGAAVFGLFQYFLYPDLRNLNYLGWDPHKFRAFGTFLDPNFLGIILVLTAIVIISQKISFISIISFISVYLVLVLTYSRSSYLAYLIGIGIICLIRKTQKLFAALVLIGFLTLLFLPRPQGSIGVRLEREDSIAARVQNWGKSLIIFKGHPLFGIGFNAYRYIQKDYGFLKEENSHAGAGADSSLFFVLATTGIIGFLGYLGISGMIWRDGSLMVKASLAAVFVHSFFNNTLFYPPVMLWLWILVGSEETDPETSSG